MDLDLERWRRLRAAAADAKHDGPSFLEVQEANDRRARARDQLERFKAAGARGNPSGPPMAHAHAGETILPGVGGHSHDDVARAHKSSVAELETRDANAEREAKRLADQLRRCSERRNTLNRLIEAIRNWAAEHSIRLPGDEPGIPAPVVVVHGAPRGTHDFLGRPT